MWKLIPALVICIVFLFFSEKNSVVEIGEFGKKEYKKKDSFWFFLLAVVFAIFAGLRISGNDTYTYTSMYLSFDINADIDWALGSNPGFWLLNSLFRKIGLSSQSFLMIYSVFTIVVYFWFIRKYSENIWLSVFLFITMGVYTFAMAAIKQTFAVAVSLIGIDFFLKKKYFFFVLLLLLAALFHPYALLFFIVPFLNFSPWSSKTKWLFLITFLVGLSMTFLMGTVISITSMIGEEFDEDSMKEAGVNFFRVLVVWAPIVLSYFVKDELSESKEKEKNLFFNLTTINACIMFIGLFGTANYFGRLANYFLIFQALSIPCIINHFKESLKKTIILIVVLCYSIYFIYEHAFIRGGFDNEYNFISITDYLLNRIMI